MSNYLILLPPSEGKEVGGKNYFQDVKDNLSFTDLQNDRIELHNEIKKKLLKLPEHKLEKVFNIKLKDSIVRKNQLLNLDNKKTLPTVKRYNGTMFKAINYDSLDEFQKNNFDSNVIFISGLFGILKPNDLIPNYKLKINAKILDLSIEKFWKERLDNSFRDISKDKIIIDFLPQAHRNVINVNLSNKYFQIVFGEIKEGKFKQIGHFSKELKGELIRYLVSHKELDEEIIKNFKHSRGHKYDEVLSNENKIVFLKG